MKLTKRTLIVSPVLGIFLALVVFSGCQIRQELDLDGAGGNFSFEVEMKDFFVEFLTEFFDIDKGVSDLKMDLSAKRGVSGVEVLRPDPSRITGRFRFADLGVLLGSAREIRDTKIITMSEKNGVRKLEIRLNRKNFGQLSEIITLFKDPYFATFGPEGSGDLSEEEYTDMIAWTFEDMEAKPGEAAASLRSSHVTLRIRVSGEIVAQNGGRKLNDREVEIKIPLVKLLILEKELYYSVEYR
jgi:hypothetical protein